VKKSEKLLARTTRVRYRTPMEETWKGIPDLAGYEVSTSGRVRKWITKKEGPRPVLYKGLATGGTVTYKLRGESYPIDELMRGAFGDRADEMEVVDNSYLDRDRTLSGHELGEIRQAEGWKPAFKVAEDFRIDSARVRSIWDGTQ